MQDKKKEDIQIQENQVSDNTASSTKIEKPRYGLKLRTHVKAGSMHSTIDGGDGGEELD